MSTAKEQNDSSNNEVECYQARSYQSDILEYISKRNGIVFLPTGAGKTYVAILAIKRFSHQLQKSVEDGGKRCIFMCNTVDLAIQQSIEIKKKTNLKVGLYVGERNVDDWTDVQWKHEILENQVFVGTAQVFLDIVQKNLIKITDLSIVIFDECHHATKKHPMHEFMHLFQQVTDTTKLPRVIGLTGVLLKGNKLNTVEFELRNLEATFRGNIVTVSTIEEYENVMLYSTKPNEKVITYIPNTQHLGLMEEVKHFIEVISMKVKTWNIGSNSTKLSKRLGRIREHSKINYIINLLNDFYFQMENFGVYTATIAIMSPLIDFEIKKRQAQTMAFRQLYRFLIGKCEHMRHQMTMKIIEYMKENSDEIVENFNIRSQKPNYHTYDVIHQFSSPKVLKLLLLLEETFKNKKPEEICGLIFVDRRYSAKCLYFVIKNYIAVHPILKKILRPNYMIGRSSIVPGIESILERRWNKSAVQDFRTGECNLIICSSVLEEGIDIQACNFVVTFDTPKTFSSYIQTKGRARQKDSIYAMFMPAIEKTEFAQRIIKYREVHELIKKYLVGRVLDRLDPNDDEILKQFCNEIEPFVIPNGACLLPSSALALVHRYCQTLPSDIFGSILPWFIKDEISQSSFVKKMTVKLVLPLQSTVREEITSDFYDSTQMCKISAAFKACIQLYKNGELNKNLLPITKRECVKQVSEVFFKNWKKYNDDVTKKAGKNQRRVYDRLCPDEFYNSLPIVGSECYAYEINFYCHFEENDYNKHIRQLLNTNCSYALLLRKPLPRLAEMPLFMDQGKISVKISEVPIKCNIKDNCDLKALIDHHIMIFHDILNCWKSFFVLDNRNKENSYLIVPMKKNEIDWEIVKNFPKLKKLKKYSVTDRINKIFKPEDYLNKVITKWYSDTDLERFVVMKILNDETPLSAFDAENPKLTFKDFFECKYGDRIEKIVQKDQFLVEVKQFTSRRNFFINAKGKSSALFKKMCSITLIPELCHNYEYPGDLWLRALFLPSILHRIYYMLHAETLRRRINIYLGIDQNDNYKPKPLITDASLHRVVDTDGNAIEERNEPQRFLDKLAPKEHESLKFKRGGIDRFWQPYLEPVQFAQHLLEIYPVELDYYTKFISGEYVNANIDLNVENDWIKSQLQISHCKANIYSPLDTLNKLAITDSPLEQKRKIQILERTISKNLGIGEQFEFLAALTTACANDVFDMERFELLGDSFLKFSISLYLINKFPSWNEGFLTEVKSKIVSNRNLLYSMLELDIPKRICASLFKPICEWLPPLVSIPRNALEMLQESDNETLLLALTPRILFDIKLDQSQIGTGLCSSDQFDNFQKSFNHNKQLAKSGVNANASEIINTFIYKESVADKVVADTLEAILGVCVKNYGIHHTFRMLRFFDLCPNEDSIMITELLNLDLGNKLLRLNIAEEDIDGFLINYQNLETNLGYKFKNRAYLLQALTHPSFPTNRITGCYQELEFIGDAILDFLVSCYIFERYEKMTPGMLTDLRASLVNNITLGCICVRHRFHHFILAENASLAEAIKNFSDFQETQLHRVTNQVRILMEESDQDIRVQNNVETKKKMNIAQNVEVPKALGDVVEALIAAVYLDSKDLLVTWNVIYGLLEPEINQFSVNVPIDPVRELYEHKHANPKFSKAIVDQDVTLIKCSFMCLDKLIDVNGFGNNSQQAKKSAAKYALQILAKHYN